MKLQTLQEFELYAMMYVAGLDMKVSKEEMKLMKQDVSPELFEQVADMFRNDSDVEAIEVIREASAAYLTTDAKKQEFIQKLRILAASDKLVHIEEANISMLEKMILNA